MLWFLRGIRKGVVTTRYPKETDAWADGLPSPPTFRSDLLTPTLAARLADACPSGALWLEGNELALDVGSCSGCGDCVTLGGEAVHRSHEFELATRDRDALVKRIPIRGAA